MAEVNRETINALKSVQGIACEMILLHYGISLVDIEEHDK
jgi:hypothetical protein